MSCTKELVANLKNFLYANKHNLAERTTQVNGYRYSES